jgi:hypothetical protein
MKSETNVEKYPRSARKTNTVAKIYIIMILLNSKQARLKNLAESQKLLAIFMTPK